MLPYDPTSGEVRRFEVATKWNSSWRRCRGVWKQPVIRTYRGSSSARFTRTTQPISQS